ncbi:Alpha/Beta hydrolase protein [Cadophora sp. MPI-SDFR-AT-0126]|nr:Alpha/Beta hydrolase protein [Leotiomycetes sp. MPI-SDFR-AT-0126]
MKITSSITSVLLAGSYVSSALAQNLSFGADNWYRSPIVTVRPITFLTQFRTSVAGNLFVPSSISNTTNSTSSSYPAIIVGHPMGATKEQSANLHATVLAESGFITLSLDLPFWGSSEGTPMNTVAPEFYAEAFSAAVDFLGAHPLVDRSRIGALGICGSGSFVISAAKTDCRIKAVATTSMYDMGAVTRYGLQRVITVEQRQAAVAVASRQRWSEVDGGRIEVTGGTPDFLTNETDAIGREFFDFYRTLRGEFTAPTTTPNLTTHPTVASQMRFLNFYPFNDIDFISPRPMLFVHGTRAHSREFSEDAYSRAGWPKELVWIEGADHVDLYDRVELIPFAKFASFFEQNLAPGMEFGC